MAYEKSALIVRAEIAGGEAEKQGFVLPVEFIAHYGVAEVAEDCSNLMGAPGLNIRPQETEIPAFGQPQPGKGRVSSFGSLPVGV